METTKVNWVEISELTVEIVENRKNVIFKSENGELCFLWKTWALSVVLNQESRFTHFAILS